MDTDQLLAERQTTHGSYEDNCRITMGIWRLLESGSSWDSLDDHMRVTLFMNALKMHRIVNGDPRVPDHWADIAGYARLTERILTAADEALLARRGLRIDHGPPLRIYVGDVEWLPPCVEREGPAVGEPRTEVRDIHPDGSPRVGVRTLTEDGLVRGEETVLGISRACIGKFWLTRDGRMALMTGVVSDCLGDKFRFETDRDKPSSETFYVLDNGRLFDGRDDPRDIVGPALRPVRRRPSPYFWGVPLPGGGPVLGRYPVGVPNIYASVFLPLRSELVGRRFRRRDGKVVMLFMFESHEEQPAVFVSENAVTFRTTREGDYMIGAMHDFDIVQMLDEGPTEHQRDPGDETRAGTPEDGGHHDRLVPRQG